jgi:L,D-transpeptidase ErfK/SrfK
MRLSVRFKRLVRPLLILILIAMAYEPCLSDETPLPSGQLAGGEFMYKVEKGDSLTSVAARFGIDLPVLAASNGLPKNSLLREGQLLQIDNRHVVPQSETDGIVINIPQRMLFYFSGGSLLRAYPLGLGRAAWPTPTGPFTVVTKEENPVWDVPESIQEEMRREGKEVQTRVPPSPENPLGKHWIATSIPGYGIHGTNAPASIYGFRTHGCIRLHPDDIADLFDRVEVGTPGLVIYQPLLLARIDQRIFLEAHRDVYRKARDPWKALREIVSARDVESLLDWEKAKAVIEKREGVARDVTKTPEPDRGNERKGIPASLSPPSVSAGRAGDRPAPTSQNRIARRGGCGFASPSLSGFSLSGEVVGVLQHSYRGEPENRLLVRR